jgi:Ring finger domain
MPSITCSQCRLQGHNRRNHRCPVNMYADLSPDDPMSLSTRSTIGLLCDAVKNITILQDVLYNPSTQLVINNTLLCFALMNIICQQITATLQSDAALEVPIINGERLLLKINNQAQRLNTMLQTHLHTESQVVITLIGMVVTANLIYPEGVPMPSLHIHSPSPSVLKRTSVYLKEIAVAIDLTVENTDEPKTCTICMDDIAASETVTTNCNHVYCSTCIKTLSTHIKDNTAKPTCSMCRGQLLELRVCNTDIHAEVTQHFNAL